MSAIAYLDIDDEITSAVARLRRLDADRIAFVLPSGSRLATSRINFRLLAREAEARGKVLEVVTGDASARALAASAGLPTHNSVASFEAGPGNPAASGGSSGPAGSQLAGLEAGAAIPAGVGVGATGAMSPDPPSPKRADSPTVLMPAVRGPQSMPPVPQVGRRPRGALPARTIVVILVIVALLAAAGSIGFLSLPSASITLVPASSSIGPISLNVTAQPGITQADPVGLVIPASTYSFDVAATQTFAATGVKVDDTPAKGEVTFSSLNTGSSNSIPGGAIVKTESGIEFQTDGPVTLPPAQIGIVGNPPAFTVIPSTRKVGVTAVVAGTTGNVAAGTIVVVPESENPKRTLVSNDAPTSGGAHSEKPQVQQGDVDAALQVLHAALAAKFSEQVANSTGVPSGTTLLVETGSLGMTTPTVDPSTLVGLIQASFDLGASAKGTVLGVDMGNVSSLAQAKVRSGVKAGFQLQDGSISITIGTPIVAGTIITFPVTASARETRQVDATALLASVKGLGLPQARTALEQYGKVSITVWPDWVTTIPSNPSRVTLTIETPAQASPGPSTGTLPSAGVGATPNVTAGTAASASPGAP